MMQVFNDDSTESLKRSCVAGDPDARLLAGQQLAQLAPELTADQQSVQHSAKVSLELASWHSLSLKPRLDLVKHLATTAGQSDTASATVQSRDSSRESSSKTKKTEQQ